MLPTSGFCTPFFWGGGGGRGTVELPFFFIDFTGNSLLTIAFYYKIKTSIGFRCRRGLNYNSLIQLLETLSVKLTRTYKQKVQLELDKLHVLTSCPK